MNAKFAGLFKLLIIATTLSATAGCASVQDAFAPGIVAQAKSAGSEAIAADSAALVPGSVDLSITNNGPRPGYSGALLPGSVDLSISNDRAALASSGALVPGSVDLSISDKGPRPAYSGALVPGSVDLARTLGDAATSGALVSATAHMPRFRR